MIKYCNINYTELLDTKDKVLFNIHWCHTNFHKTCKTAIIDNVLLCILYKILSYNDIQCTYHDYFNSCISVQPVNFNKNYILMYATVYSKIYGYKYNYKKAFINIDECMNEDNYIFKVKTINTIVSELHNIMMH